MRHTDTAKALLHSSVLNETPVKLLECISLVEALPRGTHQTIIVETLIALLPNSEQFTPYLFHVKEHDMKQKKFQWTFANTQLTPHEKEEFIAFEKSIANTLLSDVASMLEQGYKLSARLDVERDIWIVALSGTDFSAHNQETTVTSRHHTLSSGLALTLYKNNILANHRDWRDDSSEAQWG